MNYIYTHNYFRTRTIVSAYLDKVLNCKRRDRYDNREIEILSKSLSSSIGNIIGDIRKENKIKISKFNSRTWKVLI